MIKVFIELKNRVTAPTPAFFQKIQVMGASIAACGLSLVNIPEIPIKLASIGSTFMWVGGAIVAVAKCAVTTSTSDLESKQNS